MTKDIAQHDSAYMSTYISAEDNTLIAQIKS